MTKALLVHPGTQYSFRLAAQLERRHCLARFWTSLAYVPHTLLGRSIEYLPNNVQRRLSNRRLEGVAAHRLRIRPWAELRAFRRLRAGRDDQAAMFDRNKTFQTSVPSAEFAHTDVVIGFDTASWLLAERAASSRRPFLLDQSIGHPLSYQRLTPVLRKQFPEWDADLQPRHPQQLMAEEIEHRKAVRIVAASSFTRRTLADNGVSPDKIVVNAYGVDLQAFFPALTTTRSRSLRFLFLGSISARKGIPLLLKSWRSLHTRGAELWLAGSVPDGHSRLIPDLKGLRILGKFPHCELPGLLQQCDVLVFPSYFEGFGLVLLEALAAGVPILASDATAAPDLITNGVEGFITPAGDLDSLMAAMQRIIDSPEKLSPMSVAARKCAEGYSWEKYGDRWFELLSQFASCSQY